MAEVIRANDLSGDEVRFGAWVTIRSATDGAEDTYQIVGSDEADLDLDQISLESPDRESASGQTQGHVRRGGNTWGDFQLYRHRGLLPALIPLS